MSAAEPPAGQRGNLSRLEGAPRPRGRPLCCGEKRRDVRLGHCAAVPPLAPGCRWSLNSGMTQIFRNRRSLESPPLITVEGIDTRNCLADRNSCTLTYTNSVVCQQGPIPAGSERQMCIREHKVEAPCLCGGNDLFLTLCCLHIAAVTASLDVQMSGSYSPDQRRSSRSLSVTPRQKKKKSLYLHPQTLFAHSSLIIFLQTQLEVILAWKCLQNEG